MDDETFLCLDSAGSAETFMSRRVKMAISINIIVCIIGEHRRVYEGAMIWVVR